MADDAADDVAATPSRSRAARYRAALRRATVRRERGAGRHMVERWSWLVPWAVLFAVRVALTVVDLATGAGPDTHAPAVAAARCPKPVTPRVENPFGDPSPVSVVLVSKTQILVGDDPTPVVVLPPRDEIVRSGVGARYKRSGPDDLFVVPLAEAIDKERAAVRCKGDERPLEAVVVMDGTMPYRLLLEVLFTLGQRDVGKYHLMVRSGRQKLP